MTSILSSSTNFSLVAPVLEPLLTKHHSLYSGKCKGEYWEENCANALITSGFGSNWQPDFNHGVGTDQTTMCGVNISNKSGKLSSDLNTLEISGSRLTSYPSLTEKLEFLKTKHEDYIFCLATNEKDWKNKIKRYYFVVVDSDDLDYHNAEWKEMIGTKESTKNTVVGYQCIGNGYTARIQKSMSHQIWTKIDKTLFKEMHEIKVED